MERPAPTGAIDELEAALGRDVVRREGLEPFGRDATASAGHGAEPWAVLEPADAPGVAAALGACYERELPVVARGGGSGLAGGAVPVGGAVVISLARLRAVRSIDPGQWRMEVEAGLPTADVHRLARESGLFFPPDSGAAEQSQIGGNVATNAAGPRAFKYGPTRSWVTGLEVAVAPGRLVRLGGPLRKDVAPYDLVSLVCGSEGTLGIVTAAWLRLLPEPPARAVMLALYADADSGCAAIDAVLGSGEVPAALDFAEGAAIEASGSALTPSSPPEARFGVLVEVDGTRAEVERQSAELAALLAGSALEVRAPVDRAGTEALWRWRDGISLAAAARHGGKLSEDVTVAPELLREAIAEALAVGDRHGVEACTWGHAGDGNLHCAFLVRPDERSLAAAHAAGQEMLAWAAGRGGSISGEHGVGTLKGAQLRAQLEPEVLELQRALRRAFDPKGLLAPATKAAPGG